MEHELQKIGIEMIKSKDDLNVQGRKSDVLIKALKKYQELEKENKDLKEKIEALENDVDYWREMYFEG